MARRERMEDQMLEKRVALIPEDVEIEEGSAQGSILEMQLKMATSSINHEYARIEYDDTRCRERREELLDFMEDCRTQYMEARISLERHDPYALADFEADLLRQKQSTITHYSV